jgi:hypothetical protein
MDSYEEFQRILAEMKAKVDNNRSSLPPGFEQIFNGFRK